MAAATIMKNRKIAVSWQRFDLFRPNLAWWCGATSWPYGLKIWNFENPRWRRPPSWKIENAICRQRYDRLPRNLAWWCNL